MAQKWECNGKDVSRCSILLNTDCCYECRELVAAAVEGGAKDASRFIFAVAISFCLKIILSLIASIDLHKIL